MNVYLAKKEGRVIYHTDLTAMVQIDGISKPDKTVTVEEWEAAGSTAYIDASGKIVLGLTAKEKDAQAKNERLIKIDEELSELDNDSIRSARAVIHAIAKGQEPEAEDILKIDFYEGKVAELRDERKTLKN